jgi:hypothetical protein
VAVNIAVDGAYHFYGPTGLCELVVFLARLILTKSRVLDSRPLLGPTHRCRFRFHVDNCGGQHRDLHSSLPLLQGIYYYGWVAHIPVARARAD